jgi:hypothetical protein
MDPTWESILKIAGPSSLVLLFVWQSFKREERLAKRLNVIEDRWVAALENNTRATKRLTAGLEKRPCLLKKD